MPIEVDSTNPSSGYGKQGYSFAYTLRMGVIGLLAIILVIGLWAGWQLLFGPRFVFPYQIIVALLTSTTLILTGVLVITVTIFTLIQRLKSIQTTILTQRGLNTLIAIFLLTIGINLTGLLFADVTIYQTTIILTALTSSAACLAFWGVYLNGLLYSGSPQGAAQKLLTRVRKALKRDSLHATDETITLTYSILSAVEGGDFLGAISLIRAVESLAHEYDQLSAKITEENIANNIVSSLWISYDRLEHQNHPIRIMLLETIFAFGIKALESEHSHVFNIVLDNFSNRLRLTPQSQIQPQPLIDLLNSAYKFGCNLIHPEHRYLTNSKLINILSAFWQATRSSNPEIAAMTQKRLQDLNLKAATEGSNTDFATTTLALKPFIISEETEPLRQAYNETVGHLENLTVGLVESMNGKIPLLLRSIRHLVEYVKPEEFKKEILMKTFLAVKVRQSRFEILSGNQYRKMRVPADYVCLEFLALCQNAKADWFWAWLRRASGYSSIEDPMEFIKFAESFRDKNDYFDVTEEQWNTILSKINELWQGQKFRL